MPCRNTRKDFSSYYCTHRHGFTLAELLIALAILGVIATFTIPKILSTQQNQKFNAMAHEAASAIGQAYQQFKLSGDLGAATTGDDIIADYLNYVKVDTTSKIDDRPEGAGIRDCSSSNCYVLHNGGILRAHTCNFDGTNSINAVFFVFDPDGVRTNQEDSLTLVLYYDGRLTSRAYTLGATASSASCASAGAGLPSYDPDWFSW